MKLAMFQITVLVAAIAGICSCQMCMLPDNDDMEEVIKQIILSSDSSATPTVNVMEVYPVCLALDDVKDHYRLVSVVVRYTCVGHSGCPSGTAEEQIETECTSGVWSNRVQSVTDSVNTRIQNPVANFSTTPRQSCSFCLSPTLVATLGTGLVTDDVTHCVGQCISGFIHSIQPTIYLCVLQV